MRGRPQALRGRCLAAPAGDNAERKRGFQDCEGRDRGGGEEPGTLEWEIRGLGEPHRDPISAGGLCLGLLVKDEH